MAILVVFFTFLFFFLYPPSTLASTIKINEFYAAGSTSSNPDWVEIYNEGLDISLYQLIDASNNKKSLANSSCNGNFCTIDWYNSLTNSGDIIKLVLKTSPDAIIDEVSYPGNIAIPSTGQSAGRSPNVTGGWIIFSAPSKGSANNTSTPTPIPTPTPASSASSTQTSFTISNIPSHINSDQSFTADVNLTLQDKPTTSFYLKGAFRHPDKPSNYFGLTKVGSSWIKNSNSSSDQFPITTNSSGNWSGNLEVQPDTNDSGFIGSGDYLFKVARYENSNLTWSNEVTVKITSVETGEQGGTSTETSSTTSNPSTFPSVAPTSKSIISTKSKISTRSIPNTASVAAATASATPSATPSTEVKSQKQINFPLIIGILLIVSGIGLSSYIYLQNHEKIFNKFRKRN